MRRRIVISLCLLLALCVVGQASALLALESSITRLERLVESHRIQSMRAELSASSVRLERDWLAQYLGQALDEEQLRDTIWRFQDSLLQCRSCHHDSQVEDRLDGIQETFDSWLVDADSQRSARTPAAQTAPDRELLAKATGIVEATTEMVDRAHRNLIERSSDVEASVRGVWLTLYATIVLALLFGGAIAFDLQRRLTTPISELLGKIERAGEGAAPSGQAISGDTEFRRLGMALDDAYRDLRQAQDGVLQAEKMAAIGKLAAGVAHEVANPLASISSVVQMMRRRSDSDEHAKDLDLLMVHIERISRIVREFLSFSRTPPSPQRVQVDIAALLDQATDLLRFDRRAREIEILRRYDQGLRSILADADGLLVVFTNLILNAFDAINASGDGKGTLTVSVQDEADRIEIRFTDDGAGMSEQTAESAFEPLFTTKEPGAGTGLGLWICYETVRRHGGTVWIDSQEGAGTDITIELPRQDAETVG